jgi:hypothetical protein
LIKDFFQVFEHRGSAGILRTAAQQQLETENVHAPAGSIITSRNWPNKTPRVVIDGQVSVDQTTPTPGLTRSVFVPFYSDNLLLLSPHNTAYRNPIDRS